MKLKSRVWGSGLFAAVLCFASACEEKENTRIVNVNVGGSGGNGGDMAIDAGGGGAGGGATDGAAPADGGSAERSADAAAESAADVGAPDLGAPDRGGPDPIPGNYAGKPWNGVPHNIPGIIQCELYDTGGEGVAYHDTEPLNRGSGELNLNMNTPQAMFRRGEGVDISFTKANSDKYMNGMALPVNELYVGWTVAQEWLKYTVNVAETGNYMISAHTSANNENSTISFTFEDGTKTGPLPVPWTRSWNTWEHADNMAIVRLTAGVHVMTLKSETVGQNNFDYITFTRKP